RHALLPPGRDHRRRGAARRRDRRAARRPVRRRAPQGDACVLAAAAAARRQAASQVELPGSAEVAGVKRLTLAGAASAAILLALGGCARESATLPEHPVPAGGRVTITVEAAPLNPNAPG